MKSSFLTLTCLLNTVSVLSQTSWVLTGNGGTSTSDFVGTTDNAPLVFRANNQWAGFTGYPDKSNVSFGYLSLTNALGNGNGNTAFGAQALQWSSSASGNVAIGTWALEWCTEGDNNVAVGLGAMNNSMTVGNHNVAIGQKALFNNKQSENTAVGSEAGFSNTEGTGLTAVGFRALNSNTTGEFNTALGYNALLINTTGYWNVALGSGSLQWNTTGRFNTAGGNSSLHFNRTGVENTAFGEQALGGCLDGSYNTAVGCRSLWSVLYTPGVGDSGYGQGDANTAFGYESVKGITTGSWNAGMGIRALQLNTTGSDNVAMGAYTLGGNTSGNGNVAVGNNTLSNNETGSYNTAIGYNANVKAGNFTNSTAIGYGATVTASNQIVMGNSNITSVLGFVPWSTISDGRVKKNIQENVPGLIFINKLKPITYSLNMDAVNELRNKGLFYGEEDDLGHNLYTDMGTRAAQQELQVRTGFVAQDVEQAAQSIGYNFSGIIGDENGTSLYGLSYSSFVVPLVKAVQELSEQNDAKDIAIASLQQQVGELAELVNRLLEKGYLSSIEAPSVTTVDASLEQNFPNPFNQSTTINYTLPQTFRSAKIVVADNSGRIFKQISISGVGGGSITVEAGSLSAGIYFYSLYVDNTLVDTKKMILTK